MAGNIVSPFVIKANEREIDSEKISGLSKSLGLHPKLIEILLLKNIADEEGIRSFLYPSAENFFDPFLMKNMDKVVERITKAVENGETIVVYGDYDADGICASAILSLYLSELGAEVYCHIPNREGEGYGLNIDALERIIEKCEPELIITCDCGISGVEEVSYTLDLGVDIIVTDHHEIGDAVPECPVLNPKQSDCAYPFNQLCGAGVVLKLVQAHGGMEKAAEFYGLAAIATVADLVPLQQENRLIVQLGLDIESLKKNVGVKTMLEKLDLRGSVTSADIAYKIAPRINAAGRMGDAYRAFRLLTSNDVGVIQSVAEEIERDNFERKSLCNKLYDEAIEIISKENIVNNRSIIISHPDWEKGITGIVAARISNDFQRPALILVKSGDCYKGTARSVEEINIYEMLASCKDLLIEYGGHGQAAGFSIKEENIPAFKKQVNEYLNAFCQYNFVIKIKYDVDIDIDEVDVNLVRGIELLEPFGNSNNRPLFHLRAKNLKVVPLSNNEHICAVINDKINAYAFYFRRIDYLFLGDDIKEVILEFKLNGAVARNKIDAYIKAVVPTALYVDDAVAKANFIKYVNFKEHDNPEFVEYEEKDLGGLIDKNIFGTLIIAGSEESYKKFVKTQNMRYIVAHEFIYALLKNNYSRIIMSPEFDEFLMLSNYEKIIFLDRPISYGIVSYINRRSNAKIFVPKIDNSIDFIGDIDFSRETFAKYYTLMRENERLVADTLHAYATAMSFKVPDFNIKQFVVCLSVFVDLGLVLIPKKGFSVKCIAQAKANLTDSKTYVYIKEKLKNFER